MSQRETLELALAAIEAASKGYRRSDAEDDWVECIACRGWLGHRGHMESCKLVEAGNQLRKALAGLPVAGARQEPSPARITASAAAVMDVYMGGDRSWRDRMDQSEILAGADWARAVELATAALGAADVG